jgi:hypothetical protein
MFLFTVMVGVALTAAVTLGLVPLLGALIDRQRAVAAADAAALAGVRGGRAASSMIADANGATVVAWSQAGAEVTVSVQVGEQRATARATDAP